MRRSIQPDLQVDTLVLEVHPGATHLVLTRQIPKFRNGPGQLLAYSEWQVLERETVLGTVCVEHETWQDPHARPVGKIEIKHIWKVIDSLPR